MLAFDFGILDWIQLHLRCGFLDTVMPLITKLGDAGILWIVLTILLLLIPKTRKTGITMAAALIFDVLLCNLLLKPLIARVRPYDINTAVSLLIAPPTDFSFPSGHSAVSFAATTALFFKKDRLWIPALILSVCIAFSRLYLYVHYPTDVLAGILLGILTGWLGYLITKSDRIRRLFHSK